MSYSLRRRHVYFRKWKLHSPYLNEKMSNLPIDLILLILHVILRRNTIGLEREKKYCTFFLILFRSSTLRRRSSYAHASKTSSAFWAMTSSFSTQSFIASPWFWSASRSTVSRMTSESRRFINSPWNPHWRLNF